jgi:hypothetical protein
VHTTFVASGLVVDMAVDVGTVVGAEAIQELLSVEWWAEEK